MEIYNETGKLKSTVLRVTKSIGALWVQSSASVSDFGNEKIKVSIERANGNNHVILPEISLKHFILASTFGESQIMMHPSQNILTSAICELGVEGSIPLEDNERILIELTGLIASNTYKLNGIEYPQDTEDTVFFDKKSMLSEEEEKVYDVSDWDLILIDSNEVLTHVECVFSNGVRIKYSRDEFFALSKDIEGQVSFVYDTEDIIEHHPTATTGGTLVFPLEDMETIEFFKTKSLLNFSLFSGL